MRDDVTVTDWPVWATESVDVRLPDAAWQARGEQERRSLEASLAPWLVAPVEHVGSTDFVAIVLGQGGDGPSPVP